MEAVLGDTVVQHSKSVQQTGSPYCRLHEAAANRVAFQWLKDSTAHAAETKRSVQRLLFVQDRLPGCGEYHHIDQDAAANVPRIIAARLGELLAPPFLRSRRAHPLGYNS